MFAGSDRSRRTASVEGFDDGPGMTRPLPATATGGHGKRQKRVNPATPATHTHTHIAYLPYLPASPIICFGFSSVF